LINSQQCREILRPVISNGEMHRNLATQAEV
jgi:hypothetical protein